jgi:hypothetical protein
MHLRIVRFPPARRLGRRDFPRVRSQLMRSSPHVPSLPTNSAPLHGVPSHPSQAPARMTAAWVGAAVLTSIGKLPARDGIRLATAGTGNRRSCREFHRIEVRSHAS